MTLAVPGGVSPWCETFDGRRQSGLRTLAGPIDYKYIVREVSKLLLGPRL